VPVRDGLALLSKVTREGRGQVIWAMKNRNSAKI
jgi:hypothetical protein